MERDKIREERVCSRCRRRKNRTGRETWMRRRLGKTPPLGCCCCFTALTLFQGLKERDRGNQCECGTGYIAMRCDGVGSSSSLPESPSSEVDRIDCCWWWWWSAILERIPKPAIPNCKLFRDSKPSFKYHNDPDANQNIRILPTKNLPTPSKRPSLNSPFLKLQNDRAPVSKFNTRTTTTTKRPPPASPKSRSSSSSTTATTADPPPPHYHHDPHYDDHDHNNHLHHHRRPPSADLWAHNAKVRKRLPSTTNCLSPPFPVPKQRAKQQVKEHRHCFSLQPTALLPPSLP